MSILDNPITLREILDNNIYGGWILRDRIIPVYGEECHAESAFEILEEILDLTIPGKDSSHYDRVNLKKDHCQFTRKYSIYRIMYRLGFVRLSIFDNNNFEEQFYPQHDGEIIKVEFSKYAKLTDFQNRIISHAIMIDPIEIYYTWDGRIK